MLFSSSSSTLQKTPRSAPNSQPTTTTTTITRWKTPAQEQSYNRRLVSALRSAGGGAAGVKEAADSALAITARGQTRWSRAILLGRRRRRILLKAGGRIRRPRASRSAPPPRAAKAGKGEEEEGEVSDRLRVLGRLVPGCRKLAAGKLLEEAADYVAALEMQVRAMRQLADAMAAAAISARGDGEEMES